MTGIIKNTTDGVHPVPMRDYQQKLFQQLNRGFRKGEMMIISTPRQIGKSYLNQWFDANLCKEILLPTRPMKEEKYKFSRAKWYEVSLMFKSYDPIQERLDWCEQTFGPQPKNPDAWSRWYTEFTTLKFRDSKDYEWFILRWT